MTRKQLFSEEMTQVRRDFPGSDLSDLGFDWALNSFEVLCEKFEHNAHRDFLDFEGDARREARIIILESIALDNEAKKRVFIRGAEHSFGE